MIYLRLSKTTLSVREENGNARSILDRPLHAIFLRSVLGASPDCVSRIWSIPGGHGVLPSIETLIRHLDKYGVAYNLDDGCRRLMQNAAQKKEDFRVILRAGLEAKRSPCCTSPQLKSALAEGFRRKLTPKQLKAVNHLIAVKHGANFSVPGSGKTAIALAYYHVLKINGLVDALMVLGPASCFEPWESEYQLCFGVPPKGIRLAGNTKQRRRELCLGAARYDLLLTTYHSAARDLDEMSKVLMRRRYLLVLDESHYIKRPQGGKLADAVLALADHAERRLILTGTPMPNGLPDLWSQFTFLWFDQLPLGTADSFVREVTQKEDTKTAISRVRKQIQPLFFRITKRELGLPRPTFRILKCGMSPLQARIYRGVAARFLTQLAEAPTNKDALRQWRRARAVRLLQIAVNPTLLRCGCEEFELSSMDIRELALRDVIEHYAKYELPEKIALTCSLAKQLCGQSHKVVVWSTFVHNLGMLARELRAFNPVVIHGSVPIVASSDDELNREGLIAKFREDPKCRLLIANPAACAESISLHMVCHHAIYTDRSFNCAHYLQSLDRIHRLGLRPNQGTTYYILLVRDSIDEVVHHRLSEKTRCMQNMLEADLPGPVPGYWSEELGDEEVRDFQLVEEHIKSLFSR